MANGYLGDQRIREMETLMRQMCQHKGYDLDTAFKGLLDYLLWIFDPEGNKPDGWRFDAQDSEMFLQMSQAWALTMERELKAGQWYDAFGDLYMALHPGGGGKAQFFTPPSVAHVTAQTALAGLDLKEAKGTETTFGHRITINDPAAGSSRMLLAGAVIFRKMQHNQLGYDSTQQAARFPYLIAEDLDYNCVKMSAINMAIHGCFGECICHDSLCEPGEVRLGYIVNEAMWPFPTGIPSIRRYTDPRRFVSTRLWQQRKQQHEKEECTADCTSTPTGTPKKPTDNNGPETTRHQEVSAMDRHADGDLRRTVGGYDYDRHHKLTDTQIQVQDHTSETPDIGRTEKERQPPRQLTLW